jgi:hypothetical protein
MTLWRQDDRQGPGRDARQNLSGQAQEGNTARQSDDPAPSRPSDRPKQKARPQAENAS